MTSEKIISRSTGHTIQCSFRHSDSTHSSLHIRYQYGRSPRHIKSLFEIFLDNIVAVVNWKLEIGRQSVGAALKPKLPIIVVRDPPLCVVRTCRFANHTLWCFSHPEGIDRTVQPVIHPPIKKSLLVFNISCASEIIGEE